LLNSKSSRPKRSLTMANKPSTASGWPMPGATAPKAEAAKAPAEATEKPAAAPTEAADKPASGVVDPLQLWGSLTQQFQTIAANAFKEVREKTAPGTAKSPAPRNSATKKRAGQASGGRSAPAKKVATKPAKTSTAATRRRT
jgi:hypothetical protein